MRILTGSGTGSRVLIYYNADPTSGPWLLLDSSLNYNVRIPFRFPLLHLMSQFGGSYEADAPSLSYSYTDDAVFCTYWYAIYLVLSLLTAQGNSIPRAPEQRAPPTCCTYCHRLQLFSAVRTFSQVLACQVSTMESRSVVTRYLCLLIALHPLISRLLLNLRQLSQITPAKRSTSLSRKVTVLGLPS